MFDRLELLIGDKINLIKRKNVLVIGLGGVGGEATLSLGRSGIENITILDFDTIDITNINRQALAFNSTIGMKKADVCEKKLLDINPNIKIKKLDIKLDTKNIHDIIVDYDYVIDAIDDIDVKFEIIKICLDKNIKLISSMGTGNKMDPYKLKITDISKTSYDPVARILRRKIRDANIKGKIMVLSSTEAKYSNISNPIPSNAFIPNIAGLLITSYIINDIVGD